MTAISAALRTWTQERNRTDAAVRALRVLAKMSISVRGVKLGNVGGEVLGYTLVLTRDGLCIRGILNDPSIKGRSYQDPLGEVPLGCIVRVYGLTTEKLTALRRRLRAK